jgi:hypothetical protein
MKTLFKITKIINIIALLFLLLGPYGLPATGFLQVIAAISFVIQFPKNKLIYIYFALVLTFFLVWDQHSMDWLFALPISLIFFLTYIIYKQKV